MLLTIIRTVATALYWNTSSLLFFDCNTHVGYAPQEVRLLKRADFDFGKGTIYISESKWCKDRCLPVNPEIVTLCKRYDAIAQTICPGHIYFFSSKNGSAYTHGWLTAIFHKCWELSGNKETSKSCVPYDLRHNFATCTLLRWAREGKDFEAYLPYLSTYMGHAWSQPFMYMLRSWTEYH